jgi:hypothetical protein
MVGTEQGAQKWAFDYEHGASKDRDSRLRTKSRHSKKEGCMVLNTAEAHAIIRNTCCLNHVMDITEHVFILGSIDGTIVNILYVRLDWYTWGKLPPPPSQRAWVRS